MNNNSLSQFDTWLNDESSAAALVMRQWLTSVEGKDSVIFPPTYAPPQEGKAKDSWSGYNIDYLPETTICQIDSVGSQANRMEPIFKREKYMCLVPQVIININGQPTNLLDAGHRAADAIARYSGHKTTIEKAFLALQVKGDALPLAKFAPTSIVFGSWDSQGTQAKLPRIVRSVIRAYGVDELHRSSQYQTVAGAAFEDTSTESKKEDSKSDIGLAHVPAPWKPGGIRIRNDGHIRRDATISLTVIRTLSAGHDQNIQTLKLRRYILGLALIAFLAPQETYLREGCQLVPDIEYPSELRLIDQNGHHKNLEIDLDTAFVFAKSVADDFGIETPDESNFDRDEAQAELRKSKDQRKKDISNRLAKLAKEL